MRLRKVFTPVLAAGLVLSTPSCSEQTVTEEGRVVAFDHTADVSIREMTWQEVNGSETKPTEQEGRIRDIRSREVEDGCKEVGDSFWVNEQDSWDCAFTWCSTAPEDDTHCEMTYKEVWDYWYRNWLELGVCAVSSVESFEMKSLEARRDEACIDVWEAQVPRDQRQYIQTDTYWIWVEIKDEDDNIRKQAVPTENVALWSRVERGGCVEIKGLKKKPEDRKLVGAC